MTVPFVCRLLGLSLKVVEGGAMSSIITELKLKDPFFSDKPAASMQDGLKPPTRKRFPVDDPADGEVTGSVRIRD
jgi:hypothetical protein